MTKERKTPQQRQAERFQTGTNARMPSVPGVISTRPDLPADHSHEPAVPFAPHLDAESVENRIRGMQGDIRDLNSFARAYFAGTANETKIERQKEFRGRFFEFARAVLTTQPSPASFPTFLSRLHEAITIYDLQYHRSRAQNMSAAVFATDNPTREPEALDITDIRTALNLPMQAEHTAPYEQFLQEHIKDELKTGIPRLMKAIAVKIGEAENEDILEELDGLVNFYTRMLTTYNNGSLDTPTFLNYQKYIAVLLHIRPEQTKRYIEELAQRSVDGDTMAQTVNELFAAQFTKGTDVARSIYTVVKSPNALASRAVVTPESLAAFIVFASFYEALEKAIPKTKMNVERYRTIEKSLRKNAARLRELLTTSPTFRDFSQTQLQILQTHLGDKLEVNFMTE